MTSTNQVKYGEEAWDNVRKMANIDTPTFSIQQVDEEENDHDLLVVHILTSTDFQRTFTDPLLTSTDSLPTSTDFY